MINQETKPYSRAQVFYTKKADQGDLSVSGKQNFPQSPNQAEKSANKFKIIRNSIEIGGLNSKLKAAEAQAALLRQNLVTVKVSDK